MSVRLALLRLVFPEWLKLLMLNELRRVTAEGFGVAEPRWPGRSFEDRLAAYAAFTAYEGDLLTAGGDSTALGAAKERLRRGAMPMGARARRLLGIRRPEEALEAWKLLYRQIGIEVTGDPGSMIEVTRCFFAAYYSEAVCGVIEALDDGMAAGLFRGAELCAFSERLTAGQTCCRATLRLEGGEA